MAGKTLLGAFFAAGQLLGAEALAPPLDPEVASRAAAVAAIARRGLPSAPNGYTPSPVDCPSQRPSIRLADTLSQQEQDWLRQRRQNTLQPMKDFLGRLNIQGLDTNTYIDTHASQIADIPNIGIASSGGGWRALLNGAGAISAFDSRTSNSTAAGHVGGLLQSSTYLAGLSGGSWLVGSIFMNNFSTVDALLNTNPEQSASGGLWGFENSILQGPDNQVIGKTDYYTTIYSQVDAKEDRSYNTTLTDYWGRALSYQLINATNGGPAYTWSSIQNTPAFQSADAPYPIAVAIGRAPGENVISLNDTVYEFNAFEMGSWDPTTYGFAPMRYVGSEFQGGQLPDSAQCIEGFDNAGYVMGTSSSLFNTLLLNMNTLSGLPDVLTNALNSILGRISSNEEDIADWTPNPFRGWLPGTNPTANSRNLTLVDGGEDLQNIPLHPLIQPVRAVDVIFAVDSSADTSNWPNGTALVATYERATEGDNIANGTAFPAIPDVNTFVNLGLNNRPTFFGCNSSNTSSPTPLVVYLPMAPYSYHSNVSTFQLEYEKAQQRDIVQNGYNVATMGNSTLDAQWPACVGCAVLQRSLERTQTAMPDVCNGCFQRYCWNGDLNSTTPAPYLPPYKLEEDLRRTSTSDGSSMTAPTLLVMTAAMVFGMMMM